MRMRRVLPMLVVVLAMVAAACGDDTTTTTGDTTGTTAGATTATTAGAATATTAGATATTQAAGGGSAGFVTIGDETIEFDSARCYLQAQDAAAGGGQILLTGQGFGTNAAGDAISLDFSRYSADSQFAGDDISVGIGDPFSDSHQELLAHVDLGGVDLTGSTLSASGLTFKNTDDGSESTGAFELNC